MNLQGVFRQTFGKNFDQRDVMKNFALLASAFRWSRCCFESCFSLESLRYWLSSPKRRNTLTFNFVLIAMLLKQHVKRLYIKK